MSRILVENISKQFKIYRRPQDRLAEILLRRQKHELFRVLNDISFALGDGESLGIVGINGAGKSTLLKILSGTLQASSGRFEMSGQVAALLELGAGFHPEFSGRKNIHLNASLLGVPEKNIKELENEIIEFSELRDFIDRPVKTYSSGMYVRLAFSIATMVRPDILIIDEALSVGDLTFQKKCVQRMNEFKEQNKTLVFCSHSMFHIQELCERAIWLDAGRIREFGDSDRVVGHYEDFCNSKKVYHTIRHRNQPYLRIRHRERWRVANVLWCMDYSIRFAIRYRLLRFPHQILYRQQFCPPYDYQKHNPQQTNERFSFSHYGPSVVLRVIL